MLYINTMQLLFIKPFENVTLYKNKFMTFLSQAFLRSCYDIKYVNKPFTTMAFKSLPLNIRTRKKP